MHIDYAGPMNNNYYFILVESYSCWSEVYITKDITTHTTIKILREIFARCGIPNILVSDNGRQFTAHKFQEFLLNNGVTHKFTAPYHPATNGLAERYVQTLKKSLRAIQPKNAEDTHTALQSLLLQYRKTPHSVTNESPCNLMFGRQIRSRLDFLLQTVDKEGKKEDILNETKFSRGDRVMAREWHPSV